MQNRHEKPRRISGSGQVWGKILTLILLFFALLQPISSSVLAASSTISTSQDTHLQEDTPDDNYGSLVDLKVRSKSGGNNRRTIIEFDLSSVPAGAFIESATLRVFMNSAPVASRTYDVHRVTDSWSESAATWNNAAADYDATVIDSKSTSTTNNVWLEWDV
ncbi:MAG: DNRLRE domain-containing protein, partial [Chloroflexi bacterium]|nr:DNRLRE domain-containing protein [Chloroflexota bacterium]